jgi:hypothetical protein
MAEYIADAPLPSQQRWLGRIQRPFAAMYAGAAQAIDYGILPWSKKSTLRAIKDCMHDAMDQLITAASEASVLDAHSNQSDQSLFTEFKRRAESATFVRLKSNREKNGRSRTRLEKAEGIVRPTKSGKVERLLFARAFKAWFPEIAARNRLAKLLRARRIFRRGRRSDTNTRQVKIAELGTSKVPCYALSLTRLRTLES